MPAQRYGIVPFIHAAQIAVIGTAPGHVEIGHRRRRIGNLRDNRFAQTGKIALVLTLARDEDKDNTNERMR